MPIICWGNLAKSAESTERIEQSIQAYIEGHDENPNAHMGADYALGAHRLQATLDHPYNSIGWYHILDLHADRITAGALVVRGDGPYIVVQDSAYNERVRIYPEGIIVKGGNILVQNDEGYNVFDTKGVVSENNFQAPGSVNQSLLQSMSTTTNITGATITFTLDRFAWVLVFFSASCNVSNTVGNYCDFQIQLWEGGYLREGLDYWAIPNGDNSYRTHSNFYFVGLSAGEHTIFLKGAVSNSVGTPAVIVWRYKLSYVVLGT